MISPNLSIALYLRDGYSKGRPKGNIEVNLKTSGKSAFLNPSGYYLFFDLCDGNYTIQIKSEHYIDEELDYEIDGNASPSHFGEVLDLIPGPSYPFFSPEETLVRVDVKNSEDPVAGINILSSIFTEDLSRRSPPRFDMGYKFHMASKTNSNGEFVLFFGAITSDMIIDESGILYLRGPKESKIPDKKAIPILIERLRPNSASREIKIITDIRLGLNNVRHFTSNIK